MNIESKIIYGFEEDSSNRILSEKFLEQFYSNIGIYTNKIVDFSIDRIFYGIEVDFSPFSGKIFIENENNILIEQIKSLYEKYKKFHNGTYSQLEYIIVIDGNYDIDRTEYSLE